MASIAGNRIGEPLVWDYVREKWPAMVGRFGLNERYLGSMIPSIVGRFDSAIKLDEIKSFFVKYPEAGAGAAARKQAVQKVISNIQWLQSNEPKVGEWLKTHTYWMNGDMPVSQRNEMKCHSHTNIFIVLTSSSDSIFDVLDFYWSA